MCICKRCGKPNDDCEFAVCTNCYLEMTEDEVVKDMVMGGRFNREKLEKESENV